MSGTLWSICRCITALGDSSIDPVLHHRIVSLGLRATPEVEIIKQYAKKCFKDNSILDRQFHGCQVFL